jgi:hypothetical protein
MGNWSQVRRTKVKTGLVLILLAVIFAWSAGRTNAAQAPVQPPSSGTPSAAPVVTGSSSTPLAPIPPRGAESPTPRPISAPEPVKFVPAEDGVCWAVFALMTFVLIFGVITLGGRLSRDRDWNFADVMSGADGKPSASRMIAFLGFLVMTVIILGIGYSSLWVFLKTGQLPSLSGASTFLLACSGLFTPYFANQIGLAIGSPSTTPTALAPVVVQSSSPTLQMSPTGAPAVTFGPPVRPSSI